MQRRCNHAEAGEVHTGRRDSPTRSCNREFLPAVPLYIKAEDGAEEAEEKLIEDIGKLMAERIRRYKAACKAANVSI